MVLGHMAVWGGMMVALSAQEPVLRVSDAVTAALEAQPRLLASREGVEAALARESQAAWKRSGTVNTTAQYTPQQKQLIVLFPGVPPLVPPTPFEMRSLKRYSIGLDITVPLYTWGSLTAQQDSARREVQASRGQYRRVRQETVFEAVQAFHQAAIADAALKVSEESVAQRRTFLELASRRAKARAGSHLDELKAQLALSRSLTDQTESRNRASEARESLVSVTLDPRFRTARLQEPEEAAAPGPEEAEMLRRALAGRPDLDALHRQQEALALSGRAAKAGALPAVAFRGTLTQQHDEKSMIFRSEGQNYAVGLSLTWDALGRGKAGARYAELESRRREVVQQARALEASITLEVRTALGRCRETSERRELQVQALAVAEEQARLTRLAYQEGLSTALEALEADLALTGARFDLLRARLDCALARARLDLALGDK